MRTIARRLLPALLLGAALLAPATASATTSTAEAKAAGEHAVSYLRAAEQSDGSFPGFGGEWVLSALASAGVAPAGVKSGATDARTYYRNLIGNASSWPGSEPHVTDYENATLAAYASGIDPARVSSSQNLIAQILGRYVPASPGYYGEPAFFNGTVFAVLALAETKTRKDTQRVPQALLEPSIAAIRANQHTDGGWGFIKAQGSPETLASPSEAEFTGAAIAALCSAGVPVSDPAIVSARKFLAGDLESDGAFAAEFGPNTDTNAWAVQGLDACGIPAQGPEFTTSSGHTPIDYIVSQQVSGGGFQFEAGEGSANLYSTQDALRSLSGAGFTVAPAHAKGAPKWVFEKSFTAGQATSVGLIVAAGSAPLSVCSAPVAPFGSKVTLGQVLEEAKGGSSPANCVTSFTAGKGKAIVSLNGHEGSWTISTDNGTAKTAKLNSPVHVGDTLYLKG